ncbi:MAG: RsmB/NOP family class I SAM-dependent RNA methyltransferase [archaeon]
MVQRKIPEAKPEFIERMKALLNNDFKAYSKILKQEPPRSIRCNTLKISVLKLKKRLETKGWKISQPWKEYPEVMIIENPLEPGELGRSLEHLLGYYYIQELASMLPILALKPKPNELILDLCSAPGSKTTQAATSMGNTGTIIANEISLGRIKILASNLERCGVSNIIITKKEGSALCKRLKKAGFQFDKILVDAPCSGEGTLRSSFKTYAMWNIKTVKALPRIQKQLLESVLEILKPNGTIVYSTCTHAPEENEEVINYILKKYKNQIQIELISLPITCRPGIQSWESSKYDDQIKKTCRVYPQDNNTEGFFLAKLKKK